MTQQPPLPPDLFDELCPSSLVPFRFGDKWAPMVLRCLDDGPRRYSELRVPLGRVTPKVLTQSLRAAWSGTGSCHARCTPTRNCGWSTR